MATYTTNYDLIKPDSEDYYNIEDFNQNADVIDEELKKREDHESNTSNPHQVTAAQVGAAEMEHSHTWENISAGALPVYMGGTGKVGYVSTELTTAYRGITLAQETPTRVSNGTITGVYS